jgi:hypothetical protein
VWAGEADVHPEQGGDLGERPRHVVEVADVRHGLAGEVAEALLHRQRVGERLQRVGMIAQHVDDRHVDDAQPSG